MLVHTCSALKKLSAEVWTLRRLLVRALREVRNMFLGTGGRESLVMWQ